MIKLNSKTIIQFFLFSQKIVVKKNKSYIYIVYIQFMNTKNDNNILYIEYIKNIIIISRILLEYTKGIV